MIWSSRLIIPVRQPHLHLEIIKIYTDFGLSRCNSTTYHIFFSQPSQEAFTCLHSQYGCKYFYHVSSSDTNHQQGTRATRRVNNENDENMAVNTRATRAKAVTGPEDAGNPPKKALVTKKSTTNTLNPTRGRALRDVTNASKTIEVPQEGKKATVQKTVATSKTSNITTGGVTKLSRNNTSRSALGVKDNNVKPKPAADIKRPSSGSGVQKKRPQPSIAPTVATDDTIEDVEEPARKKSVSEDMVNTAKETTLEDDIVAEMDAEDLDDPSMCAEYVREIFEYYQGLEEKTMPNAQYMDHQDDLEWKMRGILIDWLIEVHLKFRLLPETLFLTVNIIDRFLSQKVVPLDKLQLVGITAMFIASKYEEVLSPHVGNFTHVADDGFSVDEVLAAERYTLSTINYDLSYPNPMNFLRRISKADNYDIQTRTLGKYLMELSLVDHRFLEWKQSHIAAAAMYLARMILDRGPWDLTLAKFSGYTEDEILPIFDTMVDFLQAPVAHEAFFKKYASKKFLKGKSITFNSNITNIPQHPSWHENGQKTTQLPREKVVVSLLVMSSLPSLKIGFLQQHEIATRQLYHSKSSTISAFKYPKWSLFSGVFGATKGRCHTFSVSAWHWRLRWLDLSYQCLHGWR